MPQLMAMGMAVAADQPKRLPAVQDGLEQMVAIIVVRLLARKVIIGASSVGEGIILTLVIVMDIAAQRMAASVRPATSQPFP